MLEWQKRVIDEKRDLEKKIEKLDRYIELNKEEMFTTQKNLMEAQLSVMKCYHSILLERIHYHGIEEV